MTHAADRRILSRGIAPAPRTLYYHSPCFDGVASAAIIWTFLAETHRWGPEGGLAPVDYRVKETWATTPMARESVVVDFLFHPQAWFWADHHATSFVGTSRDRVSESTEFHVYDSTAPSCAGLLLRELDARFGWSAPRFDDLGAWADRIDAARYVSVEEAMGGQTPAHRISASLGGTYDPEFCNDIVRALHDGGLAAADALPAVTERFESVRRSQTEGLERFRLGARLQRGIVVFDVDGKGVQVPRYAPFAVYPDARYSAGIVRGAEGAKITAMRNPWWEFPSAPIGELCAELGGGGHTRVGSVIVPPEKLPEATTMLARLVDGIRSTDQRGAGGEDDD